jgi:hypothetical protein
MVDNRVARLFFLGRPMISLCSICQTANHNPVQLLISCPSVTSSVTILVTSPVTFQNSKNPFVFLSIRDCRSHGTRDFLSHVSKEQK